jgi:hypothetical protein
MASKSQPVVKFDSLDALHHHLDQTDDPTLLILRAHLLVEERLRDVLARVCRSPDDLAAIRLSFFQVLALCRAILGRQEDPAWDFVARLNEVRNKMAHHLEPGNLDDLLGSVVEKLGAGYATRYKTSTARFRAAAFYACGYFDAIRDSVRLREAYADEDDL